MTPATEKMIATMNAQKGELVGVQCTLVALVRSLPREQQEAFFGELEIEIEHARSTLLNSPVPDEVIGGLESFVKGWNHLRDASSQT